MTYVLSDIHGEYDRWKAMLELIRFSDNDVLYVLGDVIDRKPSGLEILCDIMNRPNVQMILGNHEYMMLQTFWGVNDYDARRLWAQNGGGSTYRTMVYKTTTEERLRILRYIQDLPDHLELSVNGRTYYLVHGWIGETQYDRIWGRPEPPPIEPPIPGKTIICGHTCVYWLNLYAEDYKDERPFEIYFAPGMIAIDCGCGNDTDLRRLACLRLEDMKEYYT